MATLRRRHTLSVSNIISKKFLTQHIPPSLSTCPAFNYNKLDLWHLVGHFYILLLTGKLCMVLQKLYLILDDIFFGILKNLLGWSNSNRGYHGSNGGYEMPYPVSSDGFCESTIAEDSSLHVGCRRTISEFRRRKLYLFEVINITKLIAK